MGNTAEIAIAMPSADTCSQCSAPALSVAGAVDATAGRSLMHSSPRSVQPLVDSGRVS